MRNSPRSQSARSTNQQLPWPLTPRAQFALIPPSAAQLAPGDPLTERVKELACLYQVAAAFIEHRSDLPACLQRIAAILPAACRFPALAEACLRLDSVREQTLGFAAAAHHLRAPIIVDGKDRGEVAIAYRDADTPPADEGPFLAEERSLLDTVARQIAIFVESVEAEQRRALVEAQLRHADRLASIGQLAAGVAHELNEPLASILGFAQLSLKVDDLPPQVRADLDRIVQAALHGREIIRKLLVFARQKPAAKQPVNINALIEEAMFLLEAGCENPGVRFVHDLAPDLPEFEADPVQVRQLVTNLVINAIHAIPGRGTITVRTRFENGTIVLTVKDTGEGMPPEVARHAFDPFYTTKDVGKGTGLGLSVAQGIVMGHGGVIELDTRPDAGATFTIRLPITPPAASTTADTPRPQPEGAR